MDEERRCPQCGAVLPADGPKDFCPNCVIGVVAEDVPAPDSPAPTAQPGHRQWRRPVWLVVAAAFVVAFLLLFWIWMPAQLPRPPERFVVATSTEGDLRTGGIHPEVAISPDGTRIAYVGGGTPQTRQLYLRQLGQLDASPMAARPPSSHQMASGWRSCRETAPCAGSRCSGVAPRRCWRLRARSGA